jgi:hypothetical protein
MLLRHIAQMGERADAHGTRIAPDAYTFSLEIDCSTPMPADHVTKRVAVLKEHLGIADKRPATIALEQQALALYRGERRPRPPGKRGPPERCGGCERDERRSTGGGLSTRGLSERVTTVHARLTRSVQSSVRVIIGAGAGAICGELRRRRVLGGQARESLLFAMASSVAGFEFGVVGVGGLSQQFDLSASGLGERSRGASHGVCSEQLELRE